jgi:DNA-binding NtrC family response regulator
MTKPHGDGDSTVEESSPRAGRPGRRAAWLALIACPEAEKVGVRVALGEDEPVLLGRKVERGGICLDDPKLSRVHARVVWDGRVGEFRVGDEDSVNGTWVGGERVSVATLRHGSVLRVGDSVFVFATADPAALLQERLARAARSAASVLLLGETGTGKELAARQLHAESGRSGAFVAINTAALPRELLASELFGHARGAFSGATVERLGLFRSAQGGTLFLDEIGDLPLELQPALLRVLEERAVRPVGSEREVPVDVRVVAATHHDLRERVEAGAFRLDLRARLSELELHVPALRERLHTLPGLIASLARSLGVEPLEVTPSAMEALALDRWEQNVRGLKSLIGRVAVFGSKPYTIDLAFLEREAPGLARPHVTPAPGAAERAPRSNISREALERALAGHGGRVADVAAALGTSRAQVYRWLERYGLATSRSRKPNSS